MPLDLIYSHFKHSEMNRAAGTEQNLNLARATFLLNSTQQFKSWLNKPASGSKTNNLNNNYTSLFSNQKKKLNKVHSIVS